MGRPPQKVDFFRVWSPDMAYVLGLWCTDGMMRIKKGNNAHEVEIASVDVDHLIKISEIIGINYSLRKVNDESECHAIGYCSKEMYQDLLALGGTPRKSKVIGLPVSPPDMLPHLIRGIVDGDGSLVWDEGKPVLYIYSGSDAFLAGIGAAVETATGIPAPNIGLKRTTKYIKWSTIRAKCLIAWLHDQNPGLALERKTVIAEAFLQWEPKKKPHKGTITEKMREVFPAYLPA